LESSFLRSFSQEFGSTEILKQISQDRSQEFLISGISEQIYSRVFSRILSTGISKNFLSILLALALIFTQNKSDSPHYEMLKELQKVRFGTLA
jgi:hypothetical protein